MSKNLSKSIVTNIKKILPKISQDDLALLKHKFSSATSPGDLVLEIKNNSEKMRQQGSGKALAEVDPVLLQMANVIMLEEMAAITGVSKIIKEALEEKNTQQLEQTASTSAKAKSLFADESSRKRIVMVGYGNMGRPIAEGMMKKFGENVDLVVVNPSPRELPDGVKYYSSVEGLPADEKFDAMLISVKPQIAPKILGDYRKHLKEGAIAISIMAGTEISSVKQLLGDDVKVVRTMPSICADVGKSPTGVAFAEENNLNKNEQKFVTNIIESFGEAVQVPEDRINGITAVAGSGPAYVCHVLETAVVELQKLKGCDYEAAKKLVLDTTIEGVKPISGQRPNIDKINEALIQMEGTDSVGNLIAKTIKAIGSDANDATQAMIIGRIMDRVSTAYVNGAKNLGFPQDDAEKLVRGTIIGTAELARRPGAKSIPDLEKSVVSVRGTTEAGLGKLKAAYNGRKIDEIFSDVVEATNSRAEELGNPLRKALKIVCEKANSGKARDGALMFDVMTAISEVMLNNANQEEKSATKSSELVGLSPSTKSVVQVVNSGHQQSQSVV